MEQLQKPQYRIYYYVGNNGVYEFFRDRYNNLWFKPYCTLILPRFGLAYGFNYNMKQFTL